MKRLLLFLVKLSCTTVFISAVIIFAVKYSSSKSIYTDISTIPETETALILGATIKGSQPSPYLKDRLDKGIKLYKSGKVQKLLISGDDGNDRDDEITVMKNYLTANAVPSENIISDTSGYNTYGSMYNAKSKSKQTKIIIITQSYHLARAVFTARKLKMECYGLKADNLKYPKYLKSNIREYFAIIKSIFNIIFNSKPIEYKTA